MIKTTIDEIKERNFTKISILSTNSTRKFGLYNCQLDLLGIEELVCTIKEEKFIETQIRKVIANKISQVDIKGLRRIIGRHQYSGAQAIVLGCSELSVIFRSYNDKAFIDPIKLASSKIINQGKMEIKNG